MNRYQPIHSNRPRPALPSKRARVVAGIAAAGLLAGLGFAVAGTASADVNAVVDGGFEDGVSAWTITSGATLTRSAGGHSGSFSALISNPGTAAMTVALNDKVNTIASTVKGRSYTATAWVRAVTPKQSVGIRLMEYAGSQFRGQGRGTLWLTDTSWHQISVTYVAVSDGATLDLNLLDWRMPSKASLAVDDVALLVPVTPVAAKPAASPSPSDTPTPKATTASPKPAPTTAAPDPTTAAPAPADPAPAPASGWNLAWSDEFNGGAVDLSKWNVRNNSSLSYDLARIMSDNVTEHDGSLYIEARRQSIGGRDYTTGYLDTIGKMSRTYGRYEIRAKLPTQAGASQGLWPAFWLRPDDGGKGEIDIMEAVGETSTSKPNQTSQTIHYDYSGTVPHQGHADYIPGGVTADWHTYAVEWEPGSLKFYVDDRLVYTRTSATTPWLDEVFSRNFNIRLNLQVGGSWPGSPNADTLLPASYQVDYVRVYSKA